MGGLILSDEWMKGGLREKVRGRARGREGGGTMVGIY